MRWYSRWQAVQWLTCADVEKAGLGGWPTGVGLLLDQLGNYWCRSTESVKDSSFGKFVHGLNIQVHTQVFSFIVLWERQTPAQVACCCT